jgi:hypothetical protein
MLLHELDKKLAMSGDQLHEYYVRLGSFLTSPAVIATYVIASLLVVIFFYELLSYALSTGLRRMFEDER